MLENLEGVKNPVPGKVKSSSKTRIVVLSCKNWVELSRCYLLRMAWVLLFTQYTPNTSSVSHVYIIMSTYVEFVRMKIGFLSTTPEQRMCSLTVSKNGESLNCSNLYSIFLMTYFLINGNSSFKSSMNPWIVFKYQLVKKNRMGSHEN